MNYLAHAFLSKHNQELLVGNFIADHVKGNQLEQFSAGVQKGIMMHRAIDSFTDQHPLFRSSKRLFYDGFEKYSGVLVDIYFDYFLARDFKVYNKGNLHDFAANAYTVYSSHEEKLPLRSVQFLNYVKSNNVFVRYAELEGIKTVLFHLSKRIKAPIELQHSSSILVQHQEELANNFNLFFADILREFENYK